MFGTELSTAPSAQALSGLIKEMLALITQDATGDSLAIMAEADLTLPQVVTLQALRTGGPRNVSAIAGLLHLSLPATSHLIDRLVAVELVERSEDPGDRRQKRIAITPAGAELIDRLGQSRSHEFEQAVAGLPERLQGELAVVLGKVVTRLRQQAGQGTGQAGADNEVGEVDHDTVA